MSFGNRHSNTVPTQRVAVWDAARPTNAIVQTNQPKYLAIPDRPKPGSSTKEWLHAAHQSNLRVSANNTTFVLPGAVREKISHDLSEHRRQCEDMEDEYRTADPGDGGWACLGGWMGRAENEDEVRLKGKAVTLFQAVEKIAEKTTTSARNYPNGITFEHPTFPDPYTLPDRPANSDDDDSSDDAGSPRRRATVSSRSAHWGSIRKDRKTELHVMNAAGTAASTRTRTDSESTGRSSVATAGYPAVDHADGAHSRQHLTAHAAPPPMAPPQARTHRSRYDESSSVAGASSAGQSYHTARTSATSYHTARSHEYPPSFSGSAPAICAPATAHVRHGSGSDYPGSLGRASTQVSNSPSYSTGFNATPPYDLYPGVNETTIAENSSSHGRYEMYYSARARMPPPSGRSRR